MIRTVDPRNDPAWRELDATPRGSLFGSPPWLAAISDTYGFEMSANLILDDTGRTTRRPRLLPDRRLPRPASAEPSVLRLPRSRSSTTDDQWHELVDPLVARGLPLQIRVLDADAPRHDPRFVQVDEMAWHCTDLDRDEDDLFAALHSSARQNVRAARRHGVTVRFGSDLEDVRAFHDLHRSTRKHKHRLLAQPVSFFENIWKHFAPDDSIVVGLAEHEGDVIAGSLYLMWSGVWYYKFSASIFERSVVRPNELLAWESMRLGKHRGCATYDWGVSDLDPPGLVAYKRKFATEERRVSVLRLHARRATRTRWPPKRCRCSASSPSCSPATTCPTTSPSAPARSSTATSPDAPRGQHRRATCPATVGSSINPGTGSSVAQIGPSRGGRRVRRYEPTVARPASISRTAVGTSVERRTQRTPARPWVRSTGSPIASRHEA